MGYIRKMLLVVFMISSSAFCEKFEFVGNFQIGELLTNFCLVEKCNVLSTSEISEKVLPFVIFTDNKRTAINKIKRSLENNNINFIYKKNDIILNYKTDVITRSFLDSDNEVQTVPADQFNLYLKRDSVLAVKREIQLSKVDSLKQIKLPEILFENYDLFYISFSRSFLNSLGAEWSQDFLSGSFHNLPKLIENFKLTASNINDSTFIYRKLSFTLDSIIKIDWGNEEPVLRRVYNDAGIITQEYEEKKHGLSLLINRDTSSITLNYIIRSNDEKNSVLSGSSRQNLGDTLKVSGFYTIYKEQKSGIPVLSSIPIISPLFSKIVRVRDVQYFVLILVKL